MFIRADITSHPYSARSLLSAAAIDLNAFGRYISNVSIQPLSPCDCLLYLRCAMKTPLNTSPPIARPASVRPRHFPLCARLEETQLLLSLRDDPASCILGNCPNITSRMDLQVLLTKAMMPQLGSMWRCRPACTVL